MKTSDAPAPHRLPEALSAPGHGPHVVIGGPGTGKTTLAGELVMSRLRGGAPAESILVLVPSRTAAERLRDELALRSGVTFSEPVVRTYSAYAFDLIRRAREAGLLPLVTRPPRLLSGPEQDALIGELLRGHAQDGGGPAWPAELGEAVGTRGFRREVREFLDRAAEHGADAHEVQRLAAACHVPEWDAAAAFVHEYTQVSALASAEAFEPAELVALALRLLTEHPSLAAAEDERLGLLIVDDLQEATPSQHRLVHRLARGRDAVLLASPDTVVQGFRGARPDLVRQAPEEIGTDGPAPVLELTAQHRLPAPIAAIARRLALRLPSPWGEVGRRWDAQPDVVPSSQPEGDTRPDAGETPAGVDVRLVAAPVHARRLVSRHVLEAHLSHGVPYDDIAVIVRSGSQVQETARALGLDGISTEVPPVETALRDESAVAPLLSMLERAAGAPGPRERGRLAALADAAAVESMLMGPYGRATSLDVRSLRQLLLAHERAAGGERSSTDLIAALLDGDPAGREGERADELASLGPVALPAYRLVLMLDAARAHLASDHTAATAVWAVWEAAGASDRWRKQALEERGLRSDRAHRDLDAVLALFQAAERFGDQFPGAGVARFIEHVRSQDLPMDSLARTGAAGGRVRVLTPAAAAGLEFDTVIIAGLQEGQWPTTGLRGQLLRSDDLVTVLEHGPDALRGASVGEKLRAVRDDELRQFLTAITRATRAVHLVAVQDEESTPSSFLELVRAPHAPEPVVSAVPRPRTLGTLTALLRRTVEEVPSEELAADAAGVLALLSLADPAVRGADPASWWGLAPLSSTDPVVPDGGQVRVSPSKVDAVLSSPLNWFVSAANGLPPADLARSLGTLVHGIAERLPAAEEEELMASLERHWHELELPENWEGNREHERAARMMTRLAQYYALVAGKDRVAVGLEQGFSVPLAPREEGGHPVKLTGSIDRVEVGEDGRPVIIDLKTGRSLPTKAEAERHPQLGTYQAAIRAGALAEFARGEPRLTQPTEPAGAALVAIGKETVKVSILEQAGVTAEDDWATGLVHDAAALMARPDFAALHEGTNFRCSLPGVCPICAEGRQVTEP
ncbi:ATP-dependent helicase [Galactobacter valiniphilus]|uniref:ATP-dependent helicase n=1 Tax=Galactobacter valiniphilus TaxID=2676122 RepID=UPI0037351A50